MALETSPLLDSPRPPRGPAHLSRRRFWWFVLLGIAAIVTLQLSFLPRTSVNRDFRRWHELHLTKSDVKRLFLVLLRRSSPPADASVESQVHRWLAAFSLLNSRAPSALAASSAPDLAAMVHSNMRAFGFATATHTLALPPLLHPPARLALRLVDVANARTLYAARLSEPGVKSPAFYVFGANGSVAAPYTYAHEATPHDLALLTKHNVPVAGRILVFSHPLVADHLLADKIAAAEEMGCAGVVVYGDPAAEDAISRAFRPLAPVSCRHRLPVSYNAIRPVLQTLGPAIAPFATWPYAPQPSDDSLHLEMDASFAADRMFATNIVATLEGVINDGIVVVGAARDVLTSTNPLSGHAVMLEVMRRFHMLKKIGWRPLRTIRFVSWDASRSGALGSHALTHDPTFFPTNLPVMAYINLDEDFVTGDHLFVDANPLFNHILRDAARFVPFPKNSTHYRRVAKTESAVLDIGDDDETSLYHYWYRQNGAYINNKVGAAFSGKDAGSFQFSLAAPSINLRFGQSASHNDSLYVPESGLYSLPWLSEGIDKEFVLHGLLVRFLGLLVLSLGEHEVVDYRSQDYFLRIKHFFEEFVDENSKILDRWAHKPVAASLLERSALLADLESTSHDGNGEAKITLSCVIQHMSQLLHQLHAQAAIFDEYNQSVQEMWTADYPWYKMLKKVQIYAKFKVANYKLLRLEKGLSFSEEEADKITGGNGTHHLVFEMAQGRHSVAKRRQRGAFTSMYSAMDRQDMEQFVTIVVALYERLKGVYKRIS